MINYTEMKHSDNGMPTWDAFLGPILFTANSEKEWSTQGLINETIKAVNLPKDLATMKYAKSKARIANDRAGWALSELKIAGLLDKPARGIYTVSELGQKVLKNKEIGEITREYVHSFPKYKEHNKKIQSKAKDDIKETIDSSADLTIGSVSEWAEHYNDNIAEELLKRLMGTNPYHFESLMIQLLEKMGYKGTNGESLVTQKSNDGGIDGIINQDPLGLQKVYVQVKRYAANNVVGSPEIEAFHGAFTIKHARQGVFITTSSFSAGAKAAARQLNIVPIDGEMLTNLMLQYKVGVRPKEQFELFEIDNDFFED